MRSIVANEFAKSIKESHVLGGTGMRPRPPLIAKMLAPTDARAMSKLQRFTYVGARQPAQ